MTWERFRTPEGAEVVNEDDNIRIRIITADYGEPAWVWVYTEDAEMPFYAHDIIELTNRSPEHHTLAGWQDLMIEVAEDNALLGALCENYKERGGE